MIIQFLILTLIGQLNLINAQFLDFLNLQPQNSRSAVSRPSIKDYTNQGLALVNYLTSIRRDPLSPQSSRSTPNILNLAAQGFARQTQSANAHQPRKNNFLRDVPIVPSLVGSLPGAGACLPKGTPLVPGQSPSMLQDFIRGIPVAQDVLRSFQYIPDVDPRRLMGRWYWVLASSSETERYCATSDYKEVIFNGDAASFSILDKFNERAATGAPKVGFGYGVKSGPKISVYTQSDPCPYEVVEVGPVSSQGQYEYILLSNWAKYPVIGLARDVRLFNRVFRKHMEMKLRNNGYMNFLTDVVGSFRYFDWSHCRQQTTGNVVGSLLNKLFFG